MRDVLGGHPGDVEPETRATDALLPLLGHVSEADGHRAPASTAVVEP
jgi:hypothetical protein